MRRFTLALVVVLVLTGCGAPDQANAPPATPAPTTTATTPAKSALTALASPVLAQSTPLPTQPTSLPTAAITRLPDPEGESIVRAYSFADADHGWLARGATILATSDGGQTWRARQIDTAASERWSTWPDSIQFVDLQRGWLRSSGALFYTEDAERQWTQIQ